MDKEKIKGIIQLIDFKDITTEKLFDLFQVNIGLKSSLKYADLEKNINRKLFQVTTEYKNNIDIFCDTTTLYYKGESIVDIYLADDNIELITMNPLKRKKYIIDNYAWCLLEFITDKGNILNNTEYEPKTYSKEELMDINYIG